MVGICTDWIFPVATHHYHPVCIAMEAEEKEVSTLPPMLHKSVYALKCRVYLL